jgi:hypothetical protein
MINNHIPVQSHYIDLLDGLGIRYESRHDAQWRNPQSLNPRVTLGFNIVESKGKPRVSDNTLGFR